MDLDLLKATLAELGQPRYRADQVWKWTAAGAAGYDEMTDVPQGLREELTARVPFSTLTVEHEAHAKDGTVKLLMRTADDRVLEAVLMRYRDGRRSLCLSSQSGCPLTCAFCATGKMKFGRNLTAYEILDCRRLPDIGITNRRTAVSTVGWIPGIEKMAGDPMPLRLALSLHAADEALRSELMPVNDRYPLSDVIAACQDFYELKRRMVFVEYVMLGGVNDSHAQARELVRVLDPKIFMVNLIPYNPTDSEFEGSSPKAIAAFRDELERGGLDATVRLTRGRDIDAACGQLAARA
jgi:23S rRNA (adenine2503-C2)-methyltransferase